MPNQLKLGDTDVEEINEVPIDTGILNNAKFSCCQDVSDYYRHGSKVDISSLYTTTICVAYYMEP